MARWIEEPDPISQGASKGIAFNTGRIGENTEVHIPEKLNKMRMDSIPQVQKIFDYLAMSISEIFPSWKGTRIDFRFRYLERHVVLTLQPKIEFIRVEMRTDETRYRNEQVLFPIIIPASAGYPGDSWIGAEVKTLQHAVEIVNDLERTIR